MQLSTLLDLTGTDVLPSSNPDVRDVSENSREIRPGWIFVAVRGHTLDGNSYVEDAIQRGAVAVVSERSLNISVPNVVVQDARAALADLAAAINRYPSRRLRVYGVTGTDGKTTTSYLLRAILEAAGYQTGMQTTVETCTGGTWRLALGRMTTPSAPQVQRALASMVVQGDRCAVLESSSHALVQDRLRNIEYRGATITNIGSDHLDFHGSRERYVETKASLLSMVQDLEGTHIALNADDDDSMRIGQEICRPFLLYGIRSESDVMAGDLRTESGRLRFTLQSGGEATDILLPIGGDYNAYNAMAASALAITEGISLEIIREGLQAARIPPGRLQRVDRGQPFDVYVDYAHTEQALRSVLRYLATVAHGRGARLLAVFGAAGDRDRSKRRNLARIAGEHSDFFVITNEDPFGEDPDAIMTEIATGANQAERGSRWTVEADRRRALKLAFDMARSGDVVAVTGKGHERAIAMGRESLAWNDAEVIEELLSS
jgi:UDP-N-acetylmuramoyl-L-alanyl-D-glutamate--2,6-diaminopimelate ligase